MDSIFLRIGSLLDSGTKLLVVPELSTANSGIDNNTIPWNPKILDIEESILSDFEEAIKRRGLKYYNRADAISYPHFCIALLSCKKYSLNHTKTPSIPARTYTAAWRGLSIVCATGRAETRGWLEKYMDARTAEGYCNKFGLQIVNDSSTQYLNYSSFEDGTATEDERLLSSLGFDEQVTDLSVKDEDHKYSTAIVDTYTPEGQLFTLWAYCDSGNFYDS